MEIVQTEDRHSYETYEDEVKPIGFESKPIDEDYNNVIVSRRYIIFKTNLTFEVAKSNTKGQGIWECGFVA